MDYAKPDLADALAAQYVAGTLRGPARRRFEVLLGAHATLRTAVRRWQDRLIPLTVVLAPQTPPLRVWQRVERSLWPQLAAAAPAPWWQRLGFWRGASGAASVAALALAVLLAMPSGQAPPIVIVLQGTGDAAQPQGSFVASFSADGRALVTRPLTPWLQTTACSSGRRRGAALAGRHPAPASGDCAIKLPRCLNRPTRLRWRSCRAAGRLAHRRTHKAGGVRGQAHTVRAWSHAPAAARLFCCAAWHGVAHLAATST
jgi:hypothetical protein